MGPRALLFLAVFNSILGLSVLFPILAPLGRSLGLQEIEVGALSTGYALMQFLTAAWWGRRSEHVGRKPVLLTGITGFGLTFLGFALVAEAGLDGRISHVPLFALLLSARLLGGMVSSATLPTAQAWIADLTEREDRTSGMALIGAAFGLAIIFGPAIGAGLSYFGLLWPVYFSVLASVLNAVFVIFRLREPEKRPHADERVGTAGVARQTWPLLAVAGVATIASVGMEQTIAFYYQDRLGLTEDETARFVGMALVCYGVVAVAVQGWLVRRASWPPVRLLRYGLPITLVGFATLVFAHGFVVMTLALVLQAFGQGLALPGVSAALSLAVGDGDQGTVAGLNSSAQGLGRTLGPLLGTGLYELRPELPYASSAALLVLVLLFIHTSRYVRRLS